MDEFKAGDLVVLRSGGPTMTVAVVNGEKALCTWFSGGNLSSENVHVTVLKAFKAPQPRASKPRVGGARPNFDPR